MSKAKNYCVRTILEPYASDPASHSYLAFTFTDRFPTNYSCSCAVVTGMTFGNGGSGTQLWFTAVQLKRIYSSALRSIKVSRRNEV